MMVLAFPWALAALVLLPALWWWLRTLPPPLRSLVFPPLALLRGLAAASPQARHLPWWLLALRLLVLALLIAAAAGPSFNFRPGQAKTTGPLLLAFDDGWAAAKDWPQRQNWLLDKLAIAAQQERSIFLVPTAPPVPPKWEPMTPNAAAAAVKAWKPKAWDVDRKAVLDTLPPMSGVETLWLTDGIEDGHGRDFAQALARLGNGPLVVRGQSSAVLVPVGEADTLALRVRQTGPQPATVIAWDRAGHELGRAETDQGRAELALPLVLRNLAVKVTVAGDASAAATWLVDEGFHRRLVGLVEPESTANPQPLLDQLTYVGKALQPFAAIQRGGLEDVLAASPSVLVLAGNVPAGQGDALRDWVQAGGMMLRFAGPALAQQSDDPLLPVRLRQGGRDLGGALSWDQPQKLAEFPAQSPFAGLTVPADLGVRTQVLADPSSLDRAQVWARLADGTPLVTAQKRGAGWLVLVHVTATPQWSNLPLSGLFPQMLHQLVLLSAASTVTGNGPLPAVQVLDGLGQLHSPGAEVLALTAQARPGPAHPPGWYGDAAAPQAFNLGPFVASAQALTIPAQDMAEQRNPSWDLRPALLLLALALLLLDTALTVRLMPVLLVLGLAQAQAADPADTRLAYVLTGNGAVDQKSQTGLQGLTDVLAARSMAELAAPVGIAPDSADLALYPLLYWPVRPDLPLPTVGAAQAIRRYLKQGGMILLDRQDGNGAEDGLWRRLNGILDLPPVRQLPADHVLTRSFYLMQTMPGRVEGPVWVQAEGGDHDGVAGVILGANDWAAAWAGWTPQGAQQEAAFRFGINLCMYALTGNYKADQVHLPAILDRLGQRP